MNQIFKVGEKVIALTNPSSELGQPRKKGRLYKVNAVMYCSGCGNQVINIGVKSNITSTKCGCNNSQPTNGLWWTNSQHFVRPEEISEAITHFAEKEEFEICGVLKKFEQENLVPVEKTETQK